MCKKFETWKNLCYGEIFFIAIRLERIGLHKKKFNCSMQNLSLFFTRFQTFKTVHKFAKNVYAKLTIIFENIHDFTALILWFCFKQTF